MQQAAKNTGAVVPSEEVRQGVLNLIKKIGEPAALARLDISRQTLARVAGGLPVRRATAELVAIRLQNPQGPKAA
ncbi:hypothetical protein [Sorangium sp. So ce1000]|uniref:hypothetical protein n=1 Tax=Sorangium sp. So ce1000 TaxID=3133325 RepID=UPI003F5DF3AF